MLRTLGTRLAQSSGLSVRGFSTSAARLADGVGESASSDEQRIEVGFCCVRTCSMMNPHPVRWISRRNKFFVTL